MKDLLINSAAQLGINLSETMAEQFMNYKALLLEWNAKFNLTAITDDREIILKHFIDSLSILPSAGLSGRMADVGTGAGFPGLPVKIAAPDVHMTLIDSLQKRVNFLEEAVNTLGLENVSCLHARAEDAGQDSALRESFDVCLSRAVANLSVLAEYCLPLVKVSGKFISLKGPDAEEELSTAKKAISVLGAEISAIKKIQIPNSDIIHSLIIIKKIRQTPAKYPRKAGQAAKNPL